MRKLPWILFVLAGFAFAAISVQAADNDQSKFGLVFSISGGDSGVGATWNLGNHVAFSPYFNFVRMWRNTSSSPSQISLNPARQNDLAAGAKLQLYLKNWNKMRLYVAPGYEFGRLRSMLSYKTSSYTSSSDELIHEHSAFGVLGLQYAVNNRISIFGDMGPEYQDRGSDFSSMSSGVIYSENKSSTRYHSLGIRNSLGIIFFLK
jgi:hypothetical protein